MAVRQPNVDWHRSARTSQLSLQHRTKTSLAMSVVAYANLNTSDLSPYTALKLVLYSLSHTPMLKLLNLKQQKSATGFVFTACHSTCYLARKWYFSKDTP